MARNIAEASPQKRAQLETEVHETFGNRLLRTRLKTYTHGWIHHSYMVYLKN